MANAIDNLFTQPGSAGGGAVSAGAPAGYWLEGSPEWQRYMAETDAFLRERASVNETGVAGITNPLAMTNDWRNQNNVFTGTGAQRLAWNPNTGHLMGLDASGNPIVGSEFSTSGGDRALMNASLLAAGLVGGAVAGAGASGAGAAGEAGAAAAGSGAAGGGAAAGGAAGGLGGGAAGGSAAGGAMDWYGLAANLGGTVIQDRAAARAQDQILAGTQAGIDETRRQYDQTRADFEPWRLAGANALSELQAGVSRMPTAEEVMADPGYQFALQQGQQALDRRFAAAGGRLSGASLRAASQFNQGTATNFYNQADQRRNDRLNRLASIAGLGQTATGQTAAAGQNSSNQITNLIQGGAQNQAGGTLARGGLWGNAANQFGAWYNRNRGGGGGGGYGGQPGWGSDAASDPYYMGG